MRLLFTALLSLLIATALHAQDTPLRTGDTVEIKIGGVPSEEQVMVNGAYNVDGSGNVNMPHIGNMKARGLTTAQLASNIESAYKTGQIYTNPTIAIGQQMVNRFVNVGGEVKTPQRVPYTSDLTLLSAVQAAGGFTDFANRKNVILLSGGSRTVVDTNVIMKFPDQDIRLQPGDKIIVQSSPW